MSATIDFLVSMLAEMLRQYHRAVDHDEVTCQGHPAEADYVSRVVMPRAECQEARMNLFGAIMTILIQLAWLETQGLKPEDKQYLAKALLRLEPALRPADDRFRVELDVIISGLYH